MIGPLNDEPCLPRLADECFKMRHARGSKTSSHLRTSPLRLNYPLFRHIARYYTRIMASTTLPRSAMRSLSRATPSLRSATPRIATRCLHQKASPITASPLRLRPSTHQRSQRILVSAASIGRRTLFIQTETTPNPDVSFNIRQMYNVSLTTNRPSSSIRMSECSPNR
jgi:hypothetical protein